MTSIHLIPKTTQQNLEAFGGYRAEAILVEGKLDIAFGSLR